MALIRLPTQADDARAWLFRLRHILAGAVRYARPAYVHIVKLDNWFGPRWLGFAGADGKHDLHLRWYRLAQPPFAPGRVRFEIGLRRRRAQLEPIEARRLHASPLDPLETPAFLDEHTPSGLFAWYSGNSLANGRAALMVYTVEREAQQRCWYAELCERNGVWSVNVARGTSIDELHGLETSYGDCLLPLSLELNARAVDTELWERTLDAAFSPNIAMATALLERFAHIYPENLPVRLLRARNLGLRGLYAAAENELMALEGYYDEARSRPLWLTSWAELCSLRGDEAAAEPALRELTRRCADDITRWLELGRNLTRQGKLQAAAETFEHATQLERYPDEAWYELGLVLRKQGKLDEAEHAFEEVLAIEPGDQHASEALADIRAARDILRERVELEP